MHPLLSTLQQINQRYIKERQRYYILIQYYMHQENNILYAFRVSRLDTFINDCVQRKSIFSEYEQMSYENLEKCVRMAAIDFYVDIDTKIMTTKEAEVLYALFGPPYKSSTYEFGVGKLRDIIGEI